MNDSCNDPSYQIPSRTAKNDGHHRRIIFFFNVTETKIDRNQVQTKLKKKKIDFFPSEAASLSSNTYKAL